MKKLFLIKYGEIAIKGKNRYLFEDALLQNIKKSLRNIGDFKLIKEQGRILVEPLKENYDEEEVIGRLTKIFGIIGICPVIKVDSLDFQQIQEHVLHYMKEIYQDKKITFKVEARRADKSYPSSPEIEKVGLIITTYVTLSVMYHPQVQFGLKLEIQYVFSSHSWFRRCQ